MTPGHPGTLPTLPSPSSGSSPTFLGTRAVRLRRTVPSPLYPGYSPWEAVPDKNARSFCNRAFPDGSGSRARTAELRSAARHRRQAPPRRQGAAHPATRWLPGAVVTWARRLPMVTAAAGPAGGEYGGIAAFWSGLCSPCVSSGCILRVTLLGRRALGSPAASLAPPPHSRARAPRRHLLHPGPPRGARMVSPCDPVGLGGRFGSALWRDMLGFAAWAPLRR